MGKWIHRLIDIDLASETGTCANCGPVTLGYKSRRTRTGPVCGVARSEQRKSPRWRDGKKGPHGLRLREAQEFRKGKICVICGSDKNLSVDHCHKTGAIRGVLCVKCNTGLGMFEDSTERMKTAILYLETAKTSGMITEGLAALASQRVKL